MASLSRNGRPIRQVLIGTTSGLLMVVSMETSRSILAMHEPDINQALINEETQIDARLCFELSAFEKGPITSLAVAARGDYCAACCEELNLVAFFRLNTSGPEASLTLLGFSEVRAPRHLAFAPSSSIDTSSSLPLLVIAGSSDGGRSMSEPTAQAQGELLVIQVPSESYLNRDRDAMIPPGLFTRGYLRLQSKAVAISIAPVGNSNSADSSSAGQSQHPQDDGMFFVFVAGEDRSVRRYRLLTESQKSSAKSYHSATAVTSPSRPRGHGNQLRAQYDPAELEIPPNDLQLPAAALAVVTSGSSHRHLLVASREGSVMSYSLKEMTPQGKWGLHDQSQGGCSALSASSDRQSTTVVSAGRDGVICILDMISASVAASRRAAAAAPANATFGVGRNPAGLRPGSFAHSAVSSVPSIRKGATGPGGVKGLFDSQGTVEPPFSLIQGEPPNLILGHMARSLTKVILSLF